MVWYLGCEWQQSVTKNETVWRICGNMYHLQEGRISCMLGCYFVNCEHTKYEEITYCVLHDLHYHRAPKVCLSKVSDRTVDLSCGSKSMELEVQSRLSSKRVRVHHCYWNTQIIVIVVIEQLCASAGCFPWIFLPACHRLNIKLLPVPLLLTTTLNLYNSQVFLHLGFFFLVFILIAKCLITSPRVGPGHPSSPLSIYFIFLPFYFFLSLVGFTYFLLLSIPSLSTRIVPFRFQAGGRRGDRTWVIVLFVLSVFFSLECILVFCCIGLVFCVFLQCFDTVGWVIWPVKTRPRYDL